MKYEFLIDGDVHTVNAQRRGNTLLLDIAGEVVEMTLLSAENNSLTLSHNGKLVHVSGTRQNEQRQVVFNGQTLRYSRHSQAAANSAESAGTLTSSIPAVVSEVLVAVGDTVSSGQKLILLESMKMIIPIQASADGTVTKINCAAGDSIQPNIALLEIKPT